MIEASPGCVVGAYQALLQLLLVSLDVGQVLRTRFQLQTTLGLAADHVFKQLVGMLLLVDLIFSVVFEGQRAAVYLALVALRLKPGSPPVPDVVESLEVFLIVLLLVFLSSLENTHLPNLLWKQD